jgi:hypothetical protein
MLVHWLAVTALQKPSESVQKAIEQFVARQQPSGHHIVYRLERRKWE